MSRASNMGARVGTFVLAILFLFIAVASSAVVIWQIHEDGKKTDASQTPATQNQSKPQEGKLEGTKLANFTPITTPVTELKIEDTTVGTGDEVKSSDTITADYTGALAATGVIFQSSLDSGQPFTSPLSGLIKGWQDGIPGMKVGGTRRIVIPAAEAYGAQAQDGIPANSDLVFDITLHKIGQ